LRARQRARFERAGDNGPALDVVPTCNSRRDEGHRNGWSVMRTILIRVVAGVALALAALANSANAQTGSPILNGLEVQKLVASTASADTRV
jgi:hypothetical protein